MSQTATHEWIEPLQFARQFLHHQNMVLLYAARPAPDGSWRSVLALDPFSTITSGGWEALEQAISATPETTWLGFLGYEMGDTVQVGLPSSTIELPPLWMSRFATLYYFDHHQQNITRIGTAPDAMMATESSKKNPKVTVLTSNMSRAEYLQKVDATLQQIKNGEFYQANITRKFYGEFAESPPPFDIFEKLATASQAAFSAFIKVGEKAILSASPESFLQINGSGKVFARPIKGTARRSDDAIKDQKIFDELANSSKNRAENLMIVDLMRHDLSTTCISGSVGVDNLFSIATLPHLYHMVSTISGQKRKDVSSVELIRHCFPPGSMTGAPKKRAIEWCQEMESVQRGIYSGTIGWLNGNQEAELSVVIRTLLLEGNRFEFQVGGGIVADSTAESEWEETLTKSMGIAHCLGLTLEALQTI